MSMMLIRGEKRCHMSMERYIIHCMCIYMLGAECFKRGVGWGKVKAKRMSMHRLV